MKIKIAGNPQTRQSLVVMFNKSSFRALVFCFVCVFTVKDASAATKAVLTVQYETNQGWSVAQKTKVTLATGSELFGKVNGVNVLKSYALIWFADDKVAILELQGVLGLVADLNFTQQNVEDVFGLGLPITCNQINVKGGRKWKLQKSLL